MVGLPAAAVVVLVVVVVVVVLGAMATTAAGVATADAADGSDWDGHSLRPWFFTDLKSPNSL